MLMLCLRIAGHVLSSSRFPVDIRKDGSYIINFRCWFVDMDYYGHMNNAQYFRVAEIARWKSWTGNGLIYKMWKNNWRFLIVNQSAKYLRPIPAFSKYAFMSNQSISEDGKYLDFVYTFCQHSQHIKDTKEPVMYCVLKTRVVIKEASGKTVRPSNLLKLIAPENQEE